MPQPLFAGLVVDEDDRPAETAMVGDEPCYIVDDHGFRRHIPSAGVDREVLSRMHALLKGSEALLSEQAARMLGQEDIFTKAMLEQQLKNLDQRFDQLLALGLPESARAYLGMLGFRIVINHHGEVLQVAHPAADGPSDDPQ
jgi:hypothetical protein